MMALLYHEIVSRITTLSVTSFSDVHLSFFSYFHVISFLHSNFTFEPLPWLFLFLSLVFICLIFYQLSNVTAKTSHGA